MRIRWFIGFAGFCVLAYAAVLLYFAVDLLQPARMPLQEYQKEWLQHPELHGIHITSTTCNRGLTPCLMVAPDNQFGLGERGKILRNQFINDGENLVPFGDIQGILVLLHGRNGRKENLLAVAERFAAIGFKSVIPDLPAHGDNTVKISRFSLSESEAALVANVLNDARSFFHEPDAPAGLWGLSMGGAYAIHATSSHPNLWRSLVVVSSFDSLIGVIHDKIEDFHIPFPIFAESILLFLTRGLSGIDINDANPGDWARRVKIPVLLAHGDHDRLISLARGQRLFTSFSASQMKKFIAVPGAGHNDILITTAPLYYEMSKWLLQHCK